MAFGLGLNNALTGAATGAELGSIIPGIGSGIGAAIGGGLGLLGGLFSPSQSSMQKKAWEYEKEGMALQYQYGQKAAEAQQERNLEMWNKTNFEAQREHLENAGLSPALFYGGTGGGATSAAGGQATMPSAPSTNPVAMGLQLESIKLQQQQIASQTALNMAQSDKLRADAEKTRGADTDVANATVDNLIAQTKNEKEKTNLIKAQTRFESINADLTEETINLTEDNRNLVKANLQKTVREGKKLLEEIHGMKIDNDIKEATMQNVIEQQAITTVQMIKNLTKTTAETKAIYAGINKMVADVVLQAEGNQIKWESLQNDLTKFLAEMGIESERIKQGYLGVMAQSVQGLAQLGMAYKLIAGKPMPKNLKIPAIE